MNGSDMAALCVGSIALLAIIGAAYMWGNFEASGGIEDFLERMKPTVNRPRGTAPKREDFEDYEAYEKARWRWEYEQGQDS